MFNGVLPAVPMKLSKARGFLGLCVSLKHRNWRLQMVHSGFELRFSTAFNLPTNVWEDVVIHELIHYFIAYKGLRDTSAHGKLFRKMMTEINAKYHRNVTISHKRSSLPGDSAPVSVKPRVVAVVYFMDGHRGIKVLPSTVERIRAYCRAVSCHKEVDRIELFMAAHAYLMRFPVSSALRVYAADEALLNEALSGARAVSVTW